MHRHHYVLTSKSTSIHQDTDCHWVAFDYNSADHHSDITPNPSYLNVKDLCGGYV